VCLVECTSATGLGLIVQVLVLLFVLLYRSLLSHDADSVLRAVQHEQCDSVLGCA